MAIEQIDGRSLIPAMSVHKNAGLYVAAAEALNEDLERLVRLQNQLTGAPIPDSADNVPVIRDSHELERRAQIWLSGEDRLDAIEAGLDGSYTVLPLPNRLLLREQIFDAWAGLRNARNGVLSWDPGHGTRFVSEHPGLQSPDAPLSASTRRSPQEHLDFLSQWSTYVLCGFDQAVYDDEDNYLLAGTPHFDSRRDRAVRFVAIETAGEEPRLSSGSEELAALRGLQAEYPRVRSASLYEVGVLNQRYSTGIPFNYPNGFNDTFARAVELGELVGEFDDVPAAFIGEDGSAHIGGIANAEVAPVRRAVG